MKAGIFLVGTELLNGATIDTNSIYIAEELNKYGIEIEFKMTVRDVMSEITKALTYAKKNVDLVILTGGLGPTDDDITKEAMAKFLKKKLVVDEKEKKELLKKYKAYKNPNKTNFKEVEKPEGAVSFKNDVGMAPAVYIDGMVAFPGFPNELKNMFPKFLKYYVKENNLKSQIYIKDIITYGIGESVLETTVKDLFTEGDIFYEFLVKDYGTLIRLQTKIENKKNVAKIVKKLYNRISEFIIGEDDDRIENTIYECLNLGEKPLTISTAESCTGGMVASKLIEVPGISENFIESIVSYSNEAKIKRLKVKKETLEKYGAVSEEVAREMLAGLKTDIGISTTGIAGPGGGTKDKPVGLVYIGIKVKNEVKVFKRELKGDRNKIRQRAMMHALYNLLKILSKKVR
ncbi:cinA-like protein [Fusobacterium nucleatum subsp. nucleatum ATCC 25586]|uniref:CinA-like protein n=2 Tax=Fusobacterium nucleatum subsp. nucleatum (strain ATCC 25586 / DSM 15643 / BCRC 10681 / CIP 101130 / JCM 8532 / KCTC 2640 / LMG 13131 / VPI 4355) TaxID=190304 RepID=CINAL_FUSNN|nr:CinA family nicotinamide mononucleotide deamidase-related protein [Fusobacterium nucleatum]Q8RHR9.1 RecName: Full=CinA-like protein [Fusobacterium nucleatum subsp. nucleatum ATCC 25586]AAL94028.1 Competence-damage protein cinA [Fusobacterium nucleatum subsp. nucleatum ATCC 25586]AVQ14563.1 cinA-like protein [Fusobacterium nucleatum subsp. nucleatum ATCC 25586]WMS29369.1 CinA family nicotinamide mononucleotide deamidase-related protein [Fusobacterium nucleatum]